MSTASKDAIEKKNIDRFFPLPWHVGTPEVGATTNRWATQHRRNHDFIAYVCVCIFWCMLSFLYVM